MLEERIIRVYPLGPYTFCKKKNARDDHLVLILHLLFIHVTLKYTVMVDFVVWQLFRPFMIGYHDHE